MSITDTQKQRVRDRAGNCCEYCRVSQSARLTRFQVDHIIAINDDKRVRQRLGELIVGDYPCEKA